MLYRRKTISPLLMYTSSVWILTFVIFMAGCDIKSSKEWDRVANKMRSKYPTVPQLSTDEAHRLLARRDAVKPILLDVREPEEYAVSHLSGAYLATTEKEALGVLSRFDKDSLIIVYCSVGYRSSEMAKKLQHKGFTKVYNLEGSIFKWANEGRELYQEDTLVGVVHPYNSKWRQLLDKRLWSERVD